MREASVNDRRDRSGDYPIHRDRQRRQIGEPDSRDCDSIGDDGRAFLNGQGSRCITQPVMGCASRSRVRSDQPFSQGQTADRVLIHLNTEPSANDLINILSSVVLRVDLETFLADRFKRERGLRKSGGLH